ncbi:aminoglycoside phosphotransferase family protein [Rummeliibacillus sp. NPDC094406]|uniref:aminoglycoside phosphotransferase family protein n=1 Tax=Rummeliibacillus sp. NPDC094406 TaxID=3364511 RepID=UPI00381F8E73
MIIISSLNEVVNKMKLQIESYEIPQNSYGSEVFLLHLKNGENAYLIIPYNKDKLWREHDMLTLLQGNLPVPKILDFLPSEADFNGALLLSELPGKPATGKIDSTLAFEIGKYHALMHSHTSQHYGYRTEEGFQKLKNNDWRSYIKEKFVIALEKSQPFLNIKQSDLAHQHFNQLFNSLPSPDGPCVVHFDFRLANLIIEDHHISGIIDFETSKFASTEIDFVKMQQEVWNVFPSTKEGYIVGYESIRPMIELELFQPFYTLYNAMASIGWCVDRGIEKHQDFYHENIVILNSFESIS